jgi:hypothetical protein
MINKTIFNILKASEGYHGWISGDSCINYHRPGTRRTGEVDRLGTRFTGCRKVTREDGTEGRCRVVRGWCQGWLGSIQGRGGGVVRHQAQAVGNF